MARQPNRVGGGAQTNTNGLKFEQTTSLEEALVNAGYKVIGQDVLDSDGNIIAQILPKHKLYTNLLSYRGVDYRKYVSKQLLPDEAILVGTTIYIIEKKFQNTPGSVDEKLQTCDFKKKQYAKLLAPLSITVEYYYCLNDWFKKPEYYDVKQYIHSVGCKYFFNIIPLNELGL